MLSKQLSSAAFILGLLTPAFSKPSTEKSTFQIRRRDAEIRAPISLGNAASYTIFASTGIATVAGDIDAGQVVTGDIGVGPIELTAITGFGTVSEASPIVPAWITGKTYGPITTGLQAQDAAGAVRAAFESAYTDNVASTAHSNLATNYLDVNDVTPGVYQFVGTLVVNGHIKLTGSSTDVYVFQAAGAISTGADSSVTLSPELLASNVYWVSATSFTSGVASQWIGMILTGTNVVIAGSLIGGVYSQTEVALHQATVGLPAPAAPACILVAGRDASCDANGNVNACVQGYGFDASGACSTCGLYYYTDSNSFCAKCNIGATTCSKAETDFKYSHSARTYGLSSGMCVQCTGLQGSTGGVDACADCVDGTFADGLGNCPACPYQDKTCTSSTNAITCIPYYVLQTSPSGVNDCSPCLFGTTLKAGSATCSACPQGEISGFAGDCVTCSSASDILQEYAGIEAFDHAYSTLCTSGHHHRI